MHSCETRRIQKTVSQLCGTGIAELCDCLCVHMQVVCIVHSWHKMVKSLLQYLSCTVCTCIHLSVQFVTAPFQCCCMPLHAPLRPPGWDGRGPSWSPASHHASQTSTAETAGAGERRKVQNYRWQLRKWSLLRCSRFNSHIAPVLVAPPYPPTTHSIVSDLRQTHHQTVTEGCSGREGRWRRGRRW